MALTPEALANLPTNPDTGVAEAGKDTLLYINTGTNETAAWTLVGGQRNSPLSETASSIDASHKTSGGWTTTIAGLKSWSISYTGLLIMNDSGLQAMEYAFREDKQLNVKIVYKNGSYQTGWAAVTAFSKEVAHDGVATVSATLTGVGAISEVTAASSSSSSSTTQGDDSTTNP